MLDTRAKSVLFLTLTDHNVFLFLFLFLFLFVCIQNMLGHHKGVFGWWKARDRAAAEEEEESPLRKEWATDTMLHS